MTSRAISTVVVTALALALSGCGGSVDTSYGRVYSRSVNGTGAFAQLLKGRGDEIRVAVRLTDELRDWADVVVRFAPVPGPLSKDEADWYDDWLDEEPGRRLLYVPRDFDAGPEYWGRVLKELPPNSTPRLRERVEEKIVEANRETRQFFTKPKATAPEHSWFGVKETSNFSSTCEKLSGPWALGVDELKAGVVVHDILKGPSRTVLLEGDDKPLVITWSRPGGGDVLVISNGSFLLNEPLSVPARRPLAVRAANWLGGDDDGGATPSAVVGESRRVAFVEGGSVTADKDGSQSTFHFLTIYPLNWVFGQLFVLGLAVCLAIAPRLGRPRAEPSAETDRPVAHPEALGVLLARTGQISQAREVLDDYRRWRTGPHPPIPNE